MNKTVISLYFLTPPVFGEGGPSLNTELAKGYPRKSAEVVKCCDSTIYDFLQRKVIQLPPQALHKQIDTTLTTQGKEIVL